MTAQVLHEVTLREGQTLSRVVLGYHIENAAMKTLRVSIPGLDESAAATLRASGPAVADFVPVAGEPGLWEIRFQRGVAGETTVEIEFQRTSKIGGRVCSNRCGAHVGSFSSSSRSAPAAAWRSNPVPCRAAGSAPIGRSVRQATLGTMRLAI